ncbi:MAG: polysaccharide deacetylase family protein [Bacillota bacterium]|nr:polysaccharide deacetylase family protein [Bacillota bacterium]
MRKHFWMIFISLFSCLFFFQKANATNSIRNEYENTGKVIWEVKTTEKIVALTFDDGPNPLYTPDILNALAKYKAKATFFVTGEQAERYPEIIKREANEGQEIANHTYNHHYKDDSDSDNLKEELMNTANIIKKITGKKPTLFRPVGGYLNKQIINTAFNNGYLTVLWSWHQDTKDWSKPGIEKITENVISDTRPGDIIILHDSGGDRSQTVKALENILKILYKEGFTCVTVSDMLYRSESIVPKPFQVTP